MFLIWSRYVRFLPGHAMFCLKCSCSVVFFSVLSCSVLSCLVWLCSPPVMFALCPILSCHVLSCRIVFRPCHVPVVWCPVLPCNCIIVYLLVVFMSFSPFCPVRVVSSSFVSYSALPCLIMFISCPVFLMSSLFYPVMCCPVPVRSCSCTVVSSSVV